MEIKYIDIHSHFNLPEFSADLESAIKKIEKEGTATICVGTDLASSRRAIEIAEMSPNIWATVGLHPNDSGENLDEIAFEEIVKHPKVVAVGECGFDFFRMSKESISKNDKTLFEVQKEIFIKQVVLAQRFNKPLMIHARPSRNTMDAYEETLKILSNYPEVKANFHFFVGDIEIAKQALNAGHTMSFDGPITFSHDFDEVIKMLPLSAIMAETDAPFAMPEPYRTLSRSSSLSLDDSTKYERCEPWMVCEIVKSVAFIRGEDEEEVRKAMIENAKQFFRILL